jgi:hypothetical protein
MTHNLIFYVGGVMISEGYDVLDGWADNEFNTIFLDERLKVDEFLDEMSRQIQTEIKEAA